MGVSVVASGGGSQSWTWTHIDVTKQGHVWRGVRQSYVAAGRRGQNRLQRAWTSASATGGALGSRSTPTFGRRADLRNPPHNSLARRGSITIYTCVTEGGLRSEIRRNNGWRPFRVPVSGGEGLSAKEVRHSADNNHWNNSMRPTSYLRDGKHATVLIARGMATMKKMLALGMALVLLTGALAAPAAMADTDVSASTPLDSASSAQLNNIQLAVDALDGAYVGYGDVFSFNVVVGRPHLSAAATRRRSTGGASRRGAGARGVAQVGHDAVLGLEAALWGSTTSKEGLRQPLAQDYVPASAASPHHRLERRHRLRVRRTIYEDFYINIWTTDYSVECTAVLLRRRHDWATAPAPRRSTWTARAR